MASSPRRAPWRSSFRVTFPRSDAARNRRRFHFPRGSSVKMISAMQELEREIAGLIIDALTLDVQVEAFDREAPLYGDHFGLDSIDMLEIALVVSQRYGFQIRADDVENKHV